MTYTPAVENIVSEYLRASETDITEGMAWYNDAHSFARSLDPVRFHRAAGVIAALSPLNEWENNKRKAEQFYSQRGVINWNGAKNGIGLANSVRKAIRIYNGDDALDVLSGATAQKTRAFYLGIADPEGDHSPVIDRHAFDIAIGQRTNDDARSWLNRKGEYARFSDVYREAASLIGIGPSQLQAITWLGWKGRHGIFR